MYTARMAVALLLILIIVIAYNPAVRETVRETWENIRPALVNFMDNLYAGIRNLITGNKSDTQIEQQPVAPEFNFDRIVT
jgi:hypothetical protein